MIAPDSRSVVLNFSDVTVEKKVGPYRVDAVAELEGDGKLLAIEVCAKSSCSFKKADYFRKKGIWALEIQIPVAFEMEFYDEDLIRDLMWSYLNDSGNHHWIYQGQ